jgi:hypothetical protein
VLETVILLLAALVLVPLGLGLSEDSARGPLASRLLTTVRWLQPGAAVALGASFALEQGWPAAALAVPWFVETLLVAATGALDAFRRGWRLDGAAGFTAAYLFLPVGGGWAVLSRAGMQPQEFSHAIVLLTAVHFHYAGFVLPIVAGLTAARMESDSPRLRFGLVWDGGMLAAIILGVPLVGVGISLSPHVEVAAAALLALGCTILAVRQVQAALQFRDATILALIGVSSLALLSGIALAVIYAMGEFTGHAWLSIPTMVRTHGLANAFGFALCGLAGWRLATGGRPRDTGR